LKDLISEMRTVVLTVFFVTLDSIEQMLVLYFQLFNFKGEVVSFLPHFSKFLVLVYLFPTSSAISFNHFDNFLQLLDGLFFGL